MFCESYALCEPSASPLMEISVVVATRERPRCVHDLLVSLTAQERRPAEVLLVDASDDPSSAEELRRHHSSLPIVCLYCEASVCAQRNLGIRRAKSPLVFICDDDMVLPPDYLGQLHDYLVRHPDVAAASGLVVEPGQPRHKQSQYPVESLGRLCYRFLFQLSVWGEIDHLKPSGPNSLVFALLQRYYAWRNNGLSAAGWPEITHFEAPVFRTRVWGLGASLVRRECLGNEPYDEILDRHGIGDNYALCLKLPGERPVAILTDAWVEHRKSSINRLAPNLSHYRRTLTLHYCLSRYPFFSRRNRLCFVWSLLGKYLDSRAEGDRERASSILKMLRLIMTGKNPYLLAYRRGGARFVQPTLDASECR